MTDNEAGKSEMNALARSPELMNAHDTLLCVIDMQPRLLQALPARELITWNAERLLRAADLMGVEVVATEQNPDKLGTTVDRLSDLLPRPAATKMAFSSAACGELFARQLDTLAGGGRHRALLSGIETHVCVQQTAYDLTAAGFQVLLAVDATASRHDVDYQIALRRIESAGVVLTTTEAVLFEWCSTAANREFKQISQLVKQSAPDG